MSGEKNGAAANGATRQAMAKRTSRTASHAGDQQQEKRVIKKLTKEKIEHYHDEIVGAGARADLTSRGIEAIVSLHGLKHVTKLDLSYNKLTKLADMRSVPNLTMLKLTGNNLNGEGVAEIKLLKKLVIFNAAENRISRISMDVLMHLRSLKALVLNDNAITTLDWIPKLPELNSLIVSNNRISQIPERVLAKLPNLTKISISHNQLEDLPDLSSLTQLTELRLSHNKLKKVPAHLAKLEQLRVLELGHNEIDDWEGLEAISALPSLKQLVLRGNPIAGKSLEASLAEEKAAKEAAAEDGGEAEEEAEEETEKERERKTKLFKKLDAKNKQYNFKVKRLFPMLVVRDGQRVMDKKTHGYVAPPKEEKVKKEKPEKKDKSSTTKKSDDVKASEEEEEPTAVKHEKRIKRERKAENDAHNDNVEAASAKPAKKSKLNSGESRAVNAKVEKLEAGVTKTADRVVTAVNEPAVKKESTVKKEPPVKKDLPVKKSKDKKDKKKAPKDIASGVVAVKQLKSGKKAAKAPVDFATVNFTPSVGLGGSSAWD